MAWKKSPVTGDRSRDPPTSTRTVFSWLKEQEYGPLPGSAMPIMPVVWICWTVGRTGLLKAKLPVNNTSGQVLHESKYIEPSNWISEGRAILSEETDMWKERNLFCCQFERTEINKLCCTYCSKIACCIYWCCCCCCCCNATFPPIICSKTWPRPRNRLQWAEIIRCLTLSWNSRSRK